MPVSAHPLLRLARHLWHDATGSRSAFPASALQAIEAAITAGESAHRGEIRFAVEAGLAPLDILRGLTARARAEDLFALLRVWDTEGNSGVLVYVLLADHKVEIVADRGIAARVPAAEWQAICASMRAAYATGEFATGSLNAIQAIHTLLRQHFPVADGSANPNELSNRPVRL